MSTLEIPTFHFLPLNGKVMDAWRSKRPISPDIVTCRRLRSRPRLYHRVGVAVGVGVARFWAVDHLTALGGIVGRDM